MRDRLAETDRLGHDNARAISLFRDFCINGKIDVSVSPYGRTVGLQIGPAQIHCEHAPFFGIETLNVTDLAVEFYEQNCTECPHRVTFGRVPNIASIAAERRREQAVAIADMRRETDARRDAWTARKAARDAALLAASHRIRNLAEKIDVLDGDPALTADAERVEDARRQIVETARAAPELFAPVLVEAVVTMAEALDPTAHVILLALARADVVPAQRAASVAANTLARMPMPAAGNIVAAFADVMTPQERSTACAGALFLTDEPDHLYRGAWEPQPAAIIGLAKADWPIVESHVIEALHSDDDKRREIGAHAARHLIGADVSRLSSLGDPLIRAIHGDEEVYAGRPHPTSASLRALTEAWVFDASATVELVERLGASISDESRDKLADIPRRLLWKRDDVSEAATTAAIDFLVRRLNGSWGSDVAAEAAHELTGVVDRYPRAFWPHAERLLGALILACGVDSPNEMPSSLLPAHVRELETLDKRRTANAYRRDLSDALGRLVHVGEETTLGRVFALLAASTGDEDADRRIRIALLQVLEKATTVDNVAKMLPRLYTWLLSTDPLVRSAAIRLWASCAAVVEALPANLDAFAPALLTDSFVAVHGTMVDLISRLKLSERVRRNVIREIATVAATHARSDKPDREIVRAALSAVLWSADESNSADNASARRFVVETSAVLEAHDRAMVLRWSRLRTARRESFWAVAALDVLAVADHRQLPGCDEPLLTDLIQEPHGLRHVPFERFTAIAMPGLPQHIARVPDVVALLQSAERWNDAATIASLALAQLPTTKEFESRRCHLELISDAVAAEAAVAAGSVPATWTQAIEEAPFLVQARALSLVRQTLRDVASRNPSGAADIVEHAARDIAAVGIGEPRVSSFIDALDITSLLLRYDAALRACQPDAQTILAAAKRKAGVVVREAENLAEEGDAISAFASAAAVVSDEDLDTTIHAIGRIPLPLPFVNTAFRRRTAARPSGETSEIESDVLVCIPRLNAEPIADALVVRPGTPHVLSLDVRLDAWPDDATHCEIEFLSAFPSDALQLPTLRLEPAAAERDEYGLRFSQSGVMMLRAEWPLDAEPISLPIHARFVTADGSARRALAGGYDRLSIVPYNPIRHVFSGFDQIDEKLLRMYAPLADDPSINDDDRRAFCRFFAACVRAGKIIQFDKRFKLNTRVSEAQFHDAFEALLRAEPEIGQRLTRRNPVSGGFDDLQYNGIIAELKVERHTPRAPADSARYLGQPTQYGVGVASRLSILVVFDHTPKSAPPRVIENDFDWCFPVQHGADATRYPSRVGVLIVTTNWPVPSTWSRRRIATRFSPGS